MEQLTILFRIILFLIVFDAVLFIHSFIHRYSGIMYYSTIIAIILSEVLWKTLEDQATWNDSTTVFGIVGIGMGIILIIGSTLVQCLAWKERVFLHHKIEGGPHIITTGIYKRWRHPHYIGMIGWTWGLILIQQIHIITIFGCLVTIMYMGIIKQEEKRMIRMYNEEYIQYKKQTII